MNCYHIDLILASSYTSTRNRNPCTAQPADCSPPMMTQTATLPVAALWGIVGVCTVQSGVDYRGGKSQ
jgi:hypothetical protein